MIKLEKWFENTTTEGLPFLLEAAGRCPPEDVGGAPGYAEYLEAIGDPTIQSTNICASGARSGSIPTSSIGRRSKPPSTRCPTHGNRGDAPREQNRRQAPFKRAAELRLRSFPRGTRPWRRIDAVSSATSAVLRLGRAPHESGIAFRRSVRSAHLFDRSGKPKRLPQPDGSPTFFRRQSMYTAFGGSPHRAKALDQLDDSAFELVENRII
nr:MULTISPECIES: plasmid pRiA4b ORF-3 family protein [unclassified Bradyrhizobium]